MDKNQERFYLDQFINKSGLNIQVVEKKREDPDFEIVHSSKTKGIEVSGIFKNIRGKGGSKTAELESFRSGLLIMAKEIYFQRNPIPINVKAFLTQALPHGGKGKQNVANQIVELIEAANLSDQPLRHIRIPGKKHIRFLHATTLPSGITPRWICVNNAVGWSRGLLSVELIEAIAEKEELLPVYKKDYNSVMLLLVADRTKASGMYHLIDSSSVRTLTSGFERIYLYLYPEDIYRLC
ncbi:MAG TPA: hypothetical protein VMW81_06765 [Nitrospinota bacterium]|nr:hypothetical protein [Nitrospinota bacterium]